MSDGPEPAVVETKVQPVTVKRGFVYALVEPDGRRFVGRSDAFHGPIEWTELKPA